MIPIRDTAPILTKPVVIKIIIALNIVVFLYEVSLGQQVGRFLMTFGLVPARYFHLTETGQAGFLARTYPVFTSMFLHGGWLHIIFNMLFLWIFGDNIEDRLGRARFVVFYLACG
ncbi:MAG: rhomboid family intramembrane serine protease, partial [Planctomycetes bacterium]|nr:rhomboid family intramembrane serine protease [Planctomycetota bacterium]